MSLDWSAVLTALSVVAAAVSAIASMRAVGMASRQVAAQTQATQTALFLEIYREWQAIYRVYRELLSGRRKLTLPASIQDASQYMASDEWLAVRSVFSFHEFLGACVEKDLIDLKILLAVVHVNPRLWDTLLPLIERLRTLGSMPQLYIRWQHLVERVQADPTLRQIEPPPPPTGAPGL